MEITQICRLLAFGFMMVSLEAAPILVNGSFTGPVQNFSVAPGWELLDGSPDVLNETSNVGHIGAVDFAVAPVGPSADGGTWMGLGRDPRGYFERIGQTISGFTVGGHYSLSWFVGNFGYDGFVYGPKWDGDNGIEILLDGISAGSGGMISVGDTWTTQTITFTATKETQDLSFRLSTPNRSYVSIDGVELANINNPEPTTWVLMMAGLSGVVAINRRQPARCQD